MSNRKELQKILSREIEKVNIATLADRPTSGSRYGVGDLTAQSLKERFDAFPNLVKDRLNAIIDALASSDAGKYITIPEVIKDTDNIFDFIALFCEKASDEKNISDYIEALYTKVTETEPTSRTLQEIVDDMASRIVNVGEAQSGYDIVIRSDDEFSKCLYPLYKDEENLTRAEAALMVTDDNAFNTPDPEFAAKRVLVKGVTFKTMRGYDDVRLHIFQPSIEYIKFEDCRWETHWKVSGKNPRDASAANYNLNTAPERATAFNRATDPLTLTIEGLHITEDNVSVARVSDQWGVGLRNIKALKNCYIDYPKNYKLAPEGYAALEMSCQFFDFADNCSISGLWDGTNVVNCKVSKILKRCTNVANVESMNLLDSNGALKPISAENCNNMVNLKGLINFSSCVGVAASREEAEGYAREYADTKVPIGTPSSFSDGAMVYAQLPNGDLGFVHARTGYNVNEIVMRDNKRLTYARPSNYNQKIEDYYDNPEATCGVWSKSALIPRDYVDKLVKGDSYGNNGYAPLNERKKIDNKYLPVYAPLVDGKVPAANLPSYVDDVLEYVSKFVFPFEGESGKIYIDTSTNKTYRWSGSKYVEIAQSRIPTPDEIGAVARLPHSANGVDYRVYAQDNADNGQETYLWASQTATHAGDERGSLAWRYPGGQLDVASPTSPYHATNKEYVDGKILTAESTNNNGAYGAKFSDARYIVAPKSTDMAYTNAYYVPVAELTGDQYAGQKREIKYVVSPSNASILYAGAFVIRDDNKQIYVPATPTANTHAASKKYVEDYVKQYVDSILGKS